MCDMYTHAPSDGKLLGLYGCRSAPEFVAVRSQHTCTCMLFILSAQAGDADCTVATYTSPGDGGCTAGRGGALGG